MQGKNQIIISITQDLVDEYKKLGLCCMSKVPTDLKFFVVQWGK